MMSRHVVLLEHRVTMYPLIHSGDQEIDHLISSLFIVYFNVFETRVRIQLGSKCSQYFKCPNTAYRILPVHFLLLDTGFGHFPAAPLLILQCKIGLFRFGIEKLNLLYLMFYCETIISKEKVLSTEPESRMSLTLTVLSG